MVLLENIRYNSHCTHLNIYNLPKLGEVIVQVCDIVQSTWYFLQFQRAIVWVLVTWTQAGKVET